MRLGVKRALTLALGLELGETLRLPVKLGETLNDGDDDGDGELCALPESVEVTLTDLDPEPLRDNDAVALSDALTRGEAEVHLEADNDDTELTVRRGDADCVLHALTLEETVEVIEAHALALVESDWDSDADKDVELQRLAQALPEAVGMGELEGDIAADAEVKELWLALTEELSELLLLPSTEPETVDETEGDCDSLALPLTEAAVLGDTLALLLARDDADSLKEPLAD